MALWTPQPKGFRGVSGCNNMYSGATSQIPAGTHPAEGAWTVLLPASVVTYDLGWLYVQFCNASSSGVNRNNWVDVAFDPAGGTNWTQIADNLCASNAPTSAEGGICYLMPCDIPAGSSVAFRARANVSGGAAGNVQCLVRGVAPHRLPGWRRPTYQENVNTGGGIGVPITPGAYPTYGSWVQIDTTTRDLWWWQVNYGMNDTAQAAGTCYLELAWGDGTTFHTIIEPSVWINDATESCSHVVDPFGYCEVPAGSNIYVRAMTTSGAHATDNFYVGASAWGGGA